MDSGEQPPAINEAGDTEQKPVGRWRWWFHLCVLLFFPIVPAVMGIFYYHENEPIMPESVGALLVVCARELGFFGVLLLLAWLGSRVNASQLLLRWRGGVMPFLLGFGYSVALRILIMIVVLAVVFAWLIVMVLLHGPQSINDAQHLEQLRPQTEHLINAQALTQSPLYFVLCLTLLSFVVAALREELWRSAMFAGINALFPKQFASWSGKAVGILIVALFFGMGHTAQGLAGVGITTILGIGLGAIMLAHRSIWQAVVAHGFFDATTFAALYIIAKYYPGTIPGM